MALYPHPKKLSSAVLQFSTFTNPIAYPSQPCLKFPRHPYPTPYEIFHLPKTATTADIKSRYYQLVKIHHPDIGFSSTDSTHSNESGADFKAIVAAYELLKSPARRQLYLNSGEGWRRSASSLNRSSRASRRTSSSGRSYRPSYPSSLWDWAPGSRSGWADAQESWFSAQRPSTSFRQQWQRDGLLTKNGVFISSLGCVGLLFYSFQAWKILPLLDGQRPTQDLIEPRGDDRLDREAWSSSSRLTPISNVIPPEYSHPLAPRSYKEGLDRQSQRSAKDLKRARETAIPARRFVGNGKALDAP